MLGNHDGGYWAGPRGGFRGTGEVSRLLEASGVRLLANRSADLTPNGAALRIVGVGDLWAEEIDAGKAFAGAGVRCPTVLLSHNPDSKSVLGDRDWDVMLSGHTHGGQVVMPFAGLSPAPVVDREYVAGLKRWRDRWIHVSRGVGNVGGVRFNCRPEVTLLRLVPSPQLMRQ